MVDNQGNEVSSSIGHHGFQEISKRRNRASDGEGNDGFHSRIEGKIVEGNGWEKDVADLGREGTEDGNLGGGRRAIGRDGEGDSEMVVEGEEAFGELKERD